MSGLSDRGLFYHRNLPAPSGWFRMDLVSFAGGVDWCVKLP